jgi:hypothetical protein
MFMNGPVCLSADCCLSCILRCNMPPNRDGLVQIGRKHNHLIECNLFLP